MGDYFFIMQAVYDLHTFAVKLKNKKLLECANAAIEEIKRLQGSGSK